MLKHTFNAVLKNSQPDLNAKKAINKIMIKTIGERDFSAQETMHLLLSLKLHSTTFQVLPVNLNGSRRVETNLQETDRCTKDSLLDIYANRINYKHTFPSIMSVNFIDFATKYTLKKGKLVEQSCNVVPRLFPNYSSNPKGDNYNMFCKYQLLKYKPWKNYQHDAWGSENPEDCTFVNAWHKFLSLPYAQKHVPNWTEKMQNVLDNIELSIEELTENDHQSQEEWMMLSQFHSSGVNCNAKNPKGSCNYNWHLDCTKYSEQDLGEMPNWVKTKKDNASAEIRKCEQIDTNSFSEKQKLAYDIIVNHSKLPTESKSPLLIIIIGEAGTAKSYLINGIFNYLKNKCVITATTGKAAFNISGVTIHSFLKLPIGSPRQKDLSGQSLVNLQEQLLGIDYVLIDEYSMLGQTTMGWIDRQCRQATGVKDKLFGGKSILLLGDAGQLPPVCDKPIYHSNPCNELREQGYLAYQMFNKVVILDVNQRVQGSESNQIMF
jgi:hypothetical protein